MSCHPSAQIIVPFHTIFREIVACTHLYCTAVIFVKEIEREANQRVVVLNSGHVAEEGNPRRNIAPLLKNMVYIVNVTHSAAQKSPLGVVHALDWSEYSHERLRTRSSFCSEFVICTPLLTSEAASDGLRNVSKLTCVL